MMVYNILYSHEDNDGLSLQQGGGWDSRTWQFQDSWARKSDNQEAERYLREEWTNKKIPGSETSRRTEKLDELETTENFLEKVRVAIKHLPSLHRVNSLLPTRLSLTYIKHFCFSFLFI